VIKLMINPALGPQIPGAARIAVDSIEAILMTGKFVVPGDTGVGGSPPVVAPVPAAHRETARRNTREVAPVIREA